MKAGAHEATDTRDKPYFPHRLKYLREPLVVRKLHIDGCRLIHDSISAQFWKEKS